MALRWSRSVRSWIYTGLGLVAWVVGSAVAAAEAAPPEPAQSERVVVERVSTLELPERSDSWTSLAWESQERLLLGMAHGSFGEVSVDFENSRLTLAPEGPPKGLPFWAAAQMAADGDWMLVAGPFGGVGWGHPGKGAVLGQAAFSLTWDLDVQGTRGLVLGVRRDEAGRWAGTGGVAWVGSLDRDLSDLKIVHRSAGGPGAPAFDRCGIANVTRGALLSGGRIVVIPGVEDGALLYDRDGHLLRTWTSAQLGLDTDCELTSEERQALLSSGHQQRRWLDQRRVADDVVAWPGGGFAILRRSVSRAKAHWDLRCVDGRTGEISTLPLPFASPAGDADVVRATAAVASGRISFLLFDLPLTPSDATRPAVLWVGKLREAGASSGHHLVVPGAPGPTAPSSHRSAESDSP